MFTMLMEIKILVFAQCFRNSSVNAGGWGVILLSWLLFMMFKLHEGPIVGWGRLL